MPEDSLLVLYFMIDRCAVDADLPANIPLGLYQKVKKRVIPAEAKRNAGIS
jgi:hypothetical protein